MSTLILDGRAVREALMPALADKIKALSRPPHLVIFQVGDRPDSTSFIKAKTAFGSKIGASVEHVHLSDKVTQEELIGKIKGYNADQGVHGIIVQLPLPVALDQDAIIEAIAPSKDVDALTSYNVKRWMEGREDAIWPATTRGVKELLAHYRIDLFGKHAVVVGRSMLVGKPLAALCMNENATLTVCHSKTADLAAETKKADILIVAAGRPGLIGADHLKEGAIVIDVGINTVKGEKLEDEVPGRKMVGDVDFAAAQPVASALTPVPGGVGPMTVIALFENLVDLCIS
jgi:methylenetetrahydrofolate dehydrogenase (NADP+)/methenyltetrahydrofolate cyclohydrolase